MERTDRDVGEFIETLPEDVRDDMRTLDALLSEVMEGRPRALFAGKFWGGSEQRIIGYGLQVYQRSDKTEVTWFDVGLAVQKNYLSIYLNAVDDGKYVSERYGDDLGKVKVGKSSLGFKSIDDIDLGKLRLLVEKTRDLTASNG